MKILFKHWMQFHPYDKPQRSDYYYFDLCKKTHKTLISNEFEEITKYLSEEEISLFACFLVCYFEDVISETSIWQSFTGQHMKLYQKYLPFYELDEYFHNEINIEDVFFLIWYYLSNTFYDEKIFSPNAVYIKRLGLKIYNIFDKEYEYAPENNLLKEFINIPDTEDDYYKVRLKIEWIVLDSYLFHFNRKNCELEKDNAIDSIDDEDLIRNYESYLHDINDLYIISKTTSLLALRGNEWYANILGENHKLFNDLLNIGNKKTGYFLYLKHDNNYIYLQHLATDKIINITKKSMDYSSDFSEKETMVLISVVKWKNEWWFSGAYTSFDYNADLVLDEKSSIQSRALFDDENFDQQLENIELQYNAFLKYNNNLPIAFFENQIELESFLNDFMAFYIKSLKLSKKEIANSKRKMKKKGFNKTDKSDLDLDFNDTGGLIFFNKKSGIEMVFGYNEIIPAPNNPFYNKNSSPNEITEILVSKEYSSNFVKYIITKYTINDIKFPGESDEKILLNNLDFMLRFWKKDHYHSKPQVTLI